MKRTVTSIILAGLLVQSALAADWPMFRADAARSGYTPEPLPAKLSLQWTYQPRHRPTPAWTGRDTRMPFDHAYHTVIADGTLYFACSADDKVYALDAETGKQRWAVFTDSPVRLTPALWKDRVFVASDDGHLYCLAARDGRVLWKQPGGPDDDMLLGNGRMISRWPARGGPVIRDDIVYFAAGVWPSEGIHVYALDAATGDVRWVNHDSGTIEMDQPHGTARAESGLSAQGHLVATADRVLIPTGRAVPAALDRGTGAFLYFHLQRNGRYGGSFTAASDEYFINAGRAFDAADGKFLAAGPGSAGVISPDYVIYAGKNELVAFDRDNMFTTKETVDRKGKKATKRVLTPPAWSVPTPHDLGSSLIIAGNTAIAGGEQERKITLVDLNTRSPTWTADVDGVPLGLAVAAGRLYVSTDRGTIYCFAARRVQKPPVIHPRPNQTPYGQNATYASAAEEIIRKTGVTAGYCLDLGCGNGALACELAKRTSLYICAVDPDPANVTAARRRLDAAGLYGTRVSVHQSKLDAVPYSDYFANLVVSCRSVTDGTGIVPAAQIQRIQRPYGGITCIGKPGAMKTTTRGPLAGAGIWTHQYCDVANTCSSTDTLVKGPLGMLWYTDTDLTMPSRHGRGPAPLFHDGRLIVEGLDALRAVDAYNGRVLWEYPLERILAHYDGDHLLGTAGTGSNFCLANGSIYLRRQNRCLRIDVATGRKLAEFTAPPHADGSTGTWGYIACDDDTLFGSLVNDKHVVRWNFGAQCDMSQLLTESSLLFALDATTGKPKWKYTPEHSIRHNAIAIGNGRIHLIDRPLDEIDLYERKVAERRGEKPSTAPASRPSPPSPELVTLDVHTGEPLWQTADDVHGTLLALSTEHDVLVTSYQFTRFALPSEFQTAMIAYRASDGEPLWQADVKRPKGYRSASRPVIIDRKIIFEPGAWDLLTGKPKLTRNPETNEEQPWRFSRSYGCGIIAGSTNLLVFRSATLGYLDLLCDEGTKNYGGLRPACWINAIPAGGLVLVPDATERCTCSYLIKASIALQPLRDD